MAAPAYKVNSNTAIIESDDGVVIVDTHSKPSAARVIVNRLREITAKPVRFVVNTHFHWDHWHGNEVYPAAYPGAEIITNQLTREAMVRKGLKRIQDHVRQVPGEVARLRAELAAAAAPEQRAKLQADLRLAESYLAEVRALRPALPTMAFERTMKLYRRDREIQLLYLGRAHTEGDVFVGGMRYGEIPGTGQLHRILINKNLEELRREPLLVDLRRRIRDVKQGRDGLLYLLTDEADAVMLRIEPAE